MTQHLQALQHANRVRLDGARVRDQLRAGTTTVPEAIADPRAGVLTIEALLCSQRGWGPARVRALLTGTFIRQHRQIRDLTPRQHALLATAVPA